ncbi:DUF4262 domain-containing protein [Streptomyces sp. NPDC055817]
MSDTTTPPDEKTASPYSHDVLWFFVPDGTSAPFAYTVGLAVLPGRAYELACTGLPAQLACEILNNAAEQLVEDGIDPEDGTVLDGVLIGYQVRLRRVDDPGEFRQMRAVLDEQPPVWQVLWPDPHGRFRGDPAYVDHGQPTP